MLAEQVFYQSLESAEHAVAFTGILDGHDSLVENVAGPQVEFPAGLVAKVHQHLAGQFASLDGGAVESVFVQPLSVIPGL